MLRWGTSFWNFSTTFRCVFSLLVAKCSSQNWFMRLNIHCILLFPFTVPKLFWNIGVVFFPVTLLLFICFRIQSDLLHQFACLLTLLKVVISFITSVSVPSFIAFYHWQHKDRQVQAWTERSFSSLNKDRLLCIFQYLMHGLLAHTGSSFWASQNSQNLAFLLKHCQKFPQRCVWVYGQALLFISL